MYLAWHRLLKLVYASSMVASCGLVALTSSGPQWDVRMQRAFSSHRSKPELSITAWSEKPLYRVGEPVKVGIRLTNTGPRVLRLDHEIIFQSHVRVNFEDEKGGLVEYPGWDFKVGLGYAQTADEFIRLLPGYFFGTSDVTHNLVSVRRGGTYTVHVSYGDAGARVRSRALGVKAWLGVVEAAPFKIKVE